jgi:ABC-type iron transport system FetAB ATPase subunit
LKSLIKNNKLKKDKIMSKFDEKVALYKKFMDDRDIRSNSDLLAAVTKGLGPSIYKADAETVSGSDAKELATVKNNFLIKKLGLEDTSALDEGIEEVMERIGKSERKKYRAVVYYMLVKKFDKESIYGM